MKKIFIALTAFFVLASPAFAAPTTVGYCKYGPEPSFNIRIKLIGSKSGQVFSLQKIKYRIDSESPISNASLLLQYQGKVVYYSKGLKKTLRWPTLQVKPSARLAIKKRSKINFVFSTAVDGKNYGCTGKIFFKRKRPPITTDPGGNDVFLP